MRNLLIFLFLFLIKASLTAQNLEGQALIDDLENKISLVKEDTQKIYLLKNLSFAYSMTLPERGITYGNQALALAEKLKWKKGELIAHNALGANYRSLSNNKKSIEHLEKALKINTEYLKDENFSAMLLHNIGQYYMGNDIPKAIDQFRRAMVINKRNNNKLWLINNYSQLGVIHYHQSDFPSALEAYSEALRLADELNNKEKIANSVANIAGIYYQIGDYHVSVEYFLRSIKMNEEINNTYQLANELINIGAVYIELNEYEKALEYLYKAEEINKRSGYKYLLINNYLNLGMVSLKGFKEYSKALDYLNYTLKISQELDDKNMIGSSKYFLGETYADLYLDEIRFDNTGKAERYFELAVENYKGSILASREMENSYLESQNYFNLSQLYESSGEYQKSLEFYKNYKTLEDSIYSIEKTTAIANLNSKLENELKDKEIALLSKEKELQKLELLYHEIEYSKQKQAIDLLNKDNEINLLSLGQKKQELKRQQLENNEKTTQLEFANLEKEIKDAELQRQKSQKMYLLGGFIIIILSGSGIFYFVSLQRRSKLREKVVKTEMKALRSQMNPHFVFNALGSIHNFILQNNNKDAADYLLKFSTLMRMILNNSMDELLPLEKEIKALENYMELEAIRMKYKFTYDIVIDPDIDEENTLVPSMIIQPFVENAILHGIGHKEGPGYILVKLSKSGNLLKCIIEDNGVGRKRAMEINGKFLSKKGSLGIKITNERIQIINQKSKEKGAISFTDLQEGLRVQIDLPVKEVF